MRGPVGNNLPNHTDDVIRTKTKFAVIDDYKAPIQNGYIDRELDDGIKRFQKMNNLKVDGRMNPGGETEATLIGSLFHLPKPKPRTDHLQKAHFAAVLPALAMRLATHLGMSAASAWAWWQSQSTETRERTLRDMKQIGAIDTNPNTPEPDDKSHCDEVYTNDTRTCTQTTRIKGKKAGSVCYESAAQRYASCLSEKPRDQWPDLQD